MQLRDYQVQLDRDVHTAWQSGARNVLAVLPTGAGKCLGKGTPVLMFNGSVKNVEDVIVGDRLMGPDSQPRTVLSTCRGREPLYRVVQNKGDPYVVNESHVLSLKQTGIKSTPKYPSEGGRGQIVNIAVRDYLHKSNYFKHTHKGWKAPVSFAPSDLDPDLPPYLLGIWLGDGTSNGPAVTTEDHEIVDYLFSYATSRKLLFRAEEQPGNASRTYVMSNKWIRSGSLRAALIRHGLIGNKHIPLSYKAGSTDQRKQLLAGLIDSDGYAHKSGFSITFKSRRLIEDTVFVARSLGYSARIHEKYVNGSTYYVTHMDGGAGDLPLLLGRKIPTVRKQKKDPLVTGVRLEPLGEGDYYGFEIDGDRLFMLGDFTVTHNTVIFARSLAEHSAMAGMIAGLQTGTSSVAIAHRQELVGQMSVALARCGVRHRIIAPPKTVRQIVRQQVVETGASVYDPNAPCAVAGVDTLIRQAEKLADWAATVGVWVIDEGHHVLIGNKWGRAVEMFPNALGLGVTATPTRADKKGLGRHADGVFDELVVGPCGRDLINAGWLVDYRVYSPPSDLDLSDVTIGSSGDYSQKKMANAVRRSHIVGDVVTHYQRIAYGRLGVAFVPDVQTASDTAARFQQAGVPAESISAKTPSHIRDSLIARYRRREILVLVNVDLFGEGFDLPALEVVMMARPTESFSLYCQQFGRPLRPSVPGLNELPDAAARRQAIADSEKPNAIIIDHVGNVVKFSKTWGLPDARQDWTLDGGGRRSRGSDDAIPLRACVNPQCNAVYERFHVACPHCGSRPVPAERSAPEHVDGDLTELDPNVLAAMRGEVEQVDKDPEAYRAELQQKHCPKAGEHANVKHHRTRQEMQRALRDAMAWWAGHHRARGRSDAESYRRFYHTFGVDALTAQTLDVKDAIALADRINERIIRGIE